MKIVEGLYTSAKVFTDHVEDYALTQIKLLCDHPMAKGSRVRVMPDVHPGMVGTIGLTMTVHDCIMPNVTGQDIGCGITLAKIKQKKIEYQKLDTVIREQVPEGSAIRKVPHRFSQEFPFEELRCYAHIDERRAVHSMGSLGGGNHFIEVDKGENGELYVAIHSGSRHLGKEVTEYYLKEGQKILKEQGISVPYELTYLTGELMEDYLYDQNMVQEYARISREIMLDELIKGMKWKIEETIHCNHNYIEMNPDYKLLRKGAISAKAGELVVIPINMKEGMIVGVGKGNPDWNNSAPHGSGRLLKREDVKNQYTVSGFKKEMKGIYCSCIGKDTLDEAPFAYRGIREIKEQLVESVEIREILKPVYNFKAGDKKRQHL